MGTHRLESKRLQIWTSFRYLEERKRGTRQLVASQHKDLVALEKVEFIA